MTLKERVLHAVLFEIGALLVSSAAMVAADLSSFDTALLVGMLFAGIAMAWNFIFNFVYDRFHTGAREKRGFAQRAVHALLFEGGLLLVTVPMIAYLLKLSLWAAFVADIGLTLLILLYTVVFNWAYDHLRLKFVRV